MKIRHFLFHVGLTAALIAVTLTGCFSPWTGGEGTLTLHLGSNSGGKAAVLPNEQNSLTYTVTLSGPGPAITETFSGGTTHTFSVQPGTWNVEVKGNKPAEGATEIPESTLRAYGEKTVTIEAGSAKDESIEMFSATEAETYDQLEQAFADARTDGYKEYVFVTGNIAVSEETLAVDDGKNIELRAEESVNIERYEAWVGAFTSQIFIVNEGGTLTLGKEGKQNEFLNIAGNPSGAAESNNPNAMSSLIQVEGTLVMYDAKVGHNIFQPNMEGTAPGIYVNGGTFIMHGGLIHGNTGNEMGGGVSVMNGGTFTMEGGSIEGNTATTYGGQVYVGSNGTFVMNKGTLSGGGLSGNHAMYGGGVYIEAPGSFEKTGGTIFGSNGGNSGLNAETGSAVCFATDDAVIRTRRDTLRLNDDLSTDPGGPGYENWDQDPQEEDPAGNFTITVLNGGNASAYYTVTLSDAQGTSRPPDPEEFTGDTHAINVQPGTWNVEVKGWDTNNVLQVYGEATIRIQTGSTTETITMYPAAQVTDFDQLEATFGSAPTNGKKYVFITGEEAILQVSDTPLEVRNGRDIELRAEEEVTIERDANYGGSIFSIEAGGKLTLGKVGEPDKNLTIFGGGEEFASAGSLITVEGNLVMNAAFIYGNFFSDGLAGSGVSVINDGTFTMEGGTIKGNKAVNGGQVYVGSGGAFVMNNGILSGGGLRSGLFHAQYGGGVYIADSGSFTKIAGAGTVYGNDPVTGGDNLYAEYGGAAVCFENADIVSGISIREATIGPNEFFSTESEETVWTSQPW